MSSDDSSQPPTPTKPSPDAKELKRLRTEYGLERQPDSGGKLAYSGLEFGGIVAGSIIIGLLLDNHFHTKPWWLLSLTVLGMVGGMTRLIRRVMSGADK